MALNGTALGDAIASALGVSGNAAAKANCELLATTIINYIMSNGVVNVTVTGTAAVTTAPGAAVVTATGVGTIS